MYRKIEQGKADVLAAKEKYHTKQGELAVKKSTLADLEAEVKVLTVQKSILEEQKQSLTKDKEELTQALVRWRKVYGGSNSNSILIKTPLSLFTTINIV